MKWLPYELHTHTLHSDGEHTLLEMAQQAKKLGLSGIALTDHNTMSGLEDREAVKAETGIEIIRGMEWTTFYGHMVTLGLQKYADWRDLGPKDIHKGIERVLRQGGIVGVAHPFSMGSPICTGCHWEYEITDWNDINYIEVWHGTLPAIRNYNAPAFTMWNDLLNQGYRMSATSGRDWHQSKPTDGPIAATFLGMPERGDNTDRESLALEAIRRGALSISMGPLLLCSVKVSDQEYGLGEEIFLTGSEKKAEVSVYLDYSVRAGNWVLREQMLRVEIVSNRGVVAKLELPYGNTDASHSIEIDGLTWLRAHLYGSFHNILTMIAFTNPIYVKRESSGNFLSKN